MIASVKTRSTPPVSKLHVAAQRAFRKGDLSTAKRVLKKCVVRDRRDGKAWELYGTIHYQSGNFPLAVSAFERAVATLTLSEDSHVALALSYGKLGKIPQAQLLLNALLENDALEASQLLKVAIGLHGIDRLELAIHACRKALRDDPECAQAYYDLGFYCERRGYPSCTVESLMRRALKCEPTNARYRTGLACLLCKQDRLDEAYRVVRDLGLSKVSAVTCACCLERLIVLFRRAGDQRRLVVSHQRLVELQLRGCGFDC